LTFRCNSFFFYQSYKHMSEVWKCTVCNKIKDLPGDHLKAKTEIRTDCWPCATKRLFKKVKDDGSRDLPQAEPPAAAPTPPQTAAKTAESPTPFGFAAAAALTPATSQPAAAFVFTSFTTTTHSALQTSGEKAPPAFTWGGPAAATPATQSKVAESPTPFAFAAPVGPKAPAFSFGTAQKTIAKVGTPPPSPPVAPQEAPRPSPGPTGSEVWKCNYGWPTAYIYFHPLAPKNAPKKKQNNGPEEKKNTIKK